jgi:hypothetical protein
MLGMQKKSNYVQNITGGEQCDPKRSAEDRSAKGNPPSEAMSRAHESEREAKAERGTKERRKNEFVLERWLRLSDEIRTYFKGSLEVKI